MKNKTLLASKKFNRRVFLQKASLFTAASIGPWYVNNALAAPSLNILAWREYIPRSIKNDFKNKTGININHTKIGDNGEIISKMKRSRGKNYDICTPTNMRALQWEDLDLLQPIQMKNVNINNFNPGMVEVGFRDWNFKNMGSHFLPHLWGTESIAWRTDKWMPNGLPSFGDLWESDPPINGRYMMGRTYSMMTGCGVWMHHQGKIDFWSSYINEDIAINNWEIITRYCINKKKVI